jgi:hypothetical protein
MPIAIEASLAPPPAAKATGRRLELSVAPSEPLVLHPLSETLRAVRPRRVWVSLSPETRAQVRSECLRICLELAHDAAGRS